MIVNSCKQNLDFETNITNIKQQHLNNLSLGAPLFFAKYLIKVFRSRGQTPGTPFFQILDLPLIFPSLRPIWVMNTFHIGHEKSGIFAFDEALWQLGR